MTTLLGRFVAMAAIVALGALTVLPANGQGIIRDTEIERSLRDFTNPILEAANLEPQDVRLYIINDDTLNAFVANGQRIHLHTGLIMASETPNQLIGVIAHETGHIEGGHGVRRAQDARIASRPAFISIGLGIIAIAAGAGDAGAALIASSQQFAALNFFTHTRAQEASADQAALRYLEATGRSPVGIIEFFENFRDVQLYNNAGRYPYFQTHPLASDRIASLRSGAERTGLMDQPDPPEDVYKLDMMKAKLIGFLRHPIQVLQTYPLSDESKPARYARAISAYRNDDLTSAVRQTESLIAEEPENPFFHELLGQILTENGRSDEAIEPYRRSLELAPREPLLMVGLSRALMGRGTEDDLKEAEDLLVVATALEPENAFAWHQFSLSLEQQGRRAEAQLATAEQAFHLGNCMRARSFSVRASQDLMPNTPQSRRASDITKICSTMLERDRRR